ncbi:TolC family protein [Mucilaginibacter ginkgonis]|uniref:TolC family protein n=2 Tax=Mucilaginibacter ginkgonis TaxID=2682091 RepID=A0A6I4I2M2_9SPHI|nr:TolC family protein [Mucilaginibacter ginkgonis]
MCCFIISKTAFAQRDSTLLSLKQAVEIALQNNYNIKLSQNNSSIAQNNVTLGNAGILPTVSGNFTQSNSLQNTVQTRADNTLNVINNANNTNTSYGANLNWTIFDGLNMFANYDALKQRNLLGQVRLRDTVLTTVANVMSTYYELVSQYEQIKSLKGALNISGTQLRYANDKFSVGRVSKLDVYNAQVSYNTDTAAYIASKQQFKASQIALNQLMVRDLQMEFKVADTIIVDQNIRLGDVLNKAQAENPAILESQISQRLSEINLRQVRSTRYPNIGVNGGYARGNSNTPAGFARQQQTNGFTYGLVAQINIFNGFNQWRRERNAKLQINNAGINVNLTKLNVNAQINTLFSSYLSGLDLIKLGESNVQLARKNLEISLEKYRLGTITPLEIREAQRNYLDAQVTFFNAQYQSKIAEITLKQITASVDFL